MNILALAPNWLGDAAMATPALRALKRAHSGAALSVAGTESVCALLEDAPFIDALFPLPVRASFKMLLGHAARLRPSGRDMIVVFPHSFRSALLAYLTGGDLRIGYARNGRSFLLTHSSEPYKEGGRIVPVYMAREYLELVAVVGGVDDGQGLELGVPKALADEVRENFSGPGPLVGIAPGAAFGPSKRWMPEGFAGVADRLSEACGARSVLLVGPGETALGDAVRKHARVPLLEMPRKDAGLAALKSTIACLDLLVCNDSGTRHIAVAFGTKVVCIMGSTSPRYTESPHEKGVVIREPLPCSPCQKPVCPLEHHQCMRAITPDRVAAAALETLGSPPR